MKELIIGLNHESKNVRAYLILVLANRKEKDALESYGRNLGLAFQIADDALDYYSTNKIFGKEIGKDFFEGKVTLPIIFLCQKANSKEKVFLEKIFKKRKIRTKNTHGTGCTLSSALATCLSQKKNIVKSCKISLRYVDKAIASAPGYGKGFGPLNHLVSFNLKNINV